MGYWGYLCCFSHQSIANHTPLAHNFTKWKTTTHQTHFPFEGNSELPFIMHFKNLLPAGIFWRKPERSHHP